MISGFLVYVRENSFQKEMANVYGSAEMLRGDKFSIQFSNQKFTGGTSLMVQWLRIHLPMQGTQVRALVQEDPTCRGATKPVRHNY